MSRKSKRNRPPHGISDRAMVRLPEYVYRYASVTPYLLESLRLSSFWYSHYEKLNDPFDGQIQIADRLLTNDGYPSEHHGLLRELAAKGFIWGVCCFTTDPFNQLMWSHYANGHRGVCQEFRTRKSELFKRLQRVVYTDEPRTIESMDDFARKGLLQKSTHWAYEKEWRLIGGGDMYLRYPRIALTSIRFGAKTLPETVEEVLATCRQAGFRRVRFFRMSANPTDSKLTCGPNSSTCAGEDR